MKAYQGRVAAITGGADGIGLGFGYALSKAGVRVALLDIRGDAAEAAAAAIRADGGDSKAFACDITRKSSIDEAAAAVASEMDAPSLLFANAGVGAAGGPIAAPDRVLDWVLSVNIRGTVDTLRAFVPTMAGDGPRQVCITASSASLVSPGAPLALYAGSKHATMGVAEAAAAELDAMGIASTIFCPGLLNTRIWDGGRARPDHFGGARHQPEEAGEFWRTQGMPVAWAVEECLSAMEQGKRYCAPVDAHSVDDFEKRVAAIRQGFARWQDRDESRWPTLG